MRNFSLEFLKHINVISYIQVRAAAKLERQARDMAKGSTRQETRSLPRHEVTTPSPRSHKHEAMSGNNRSFCDACSRKHFNIKQILGASSFTRADKLSLSLPTPGLMLEFWLWEGDSSPCLPLFLSGSGSPSSTNTFCTASVPRLVRDGVWSSLVGEHLFPQSFCLKHSTAVKLNTQMSRTIPCQPGLEGSMLLMEALSCTMACLQLRSACAPP